MLIIGSSKQILFWGLRDLFFSLKKNCKGIHFILFFLKVEKLEQKLTQIKKQFSHKILY